VLSFQGGEAVISQTRKILWPAVLSLILLFSRAGLALSSETGPYDVRLVRLAEASVSGDNESPLSGLVLEIENREPVLFLTIEAPSVKVTTTDGKQHTPALVFLVDIPKGRVSTGAQYTKMVEKEIMIGGTRYQTRKSGKNIGVKLEKEVKASFRFEELSVLRLGFIFAVDHKDINRLDFFETAVDLGPAAPDGNGDGRR
jgi:hypothetical protein